MVLRNLPHEGAAFRSLTGMPTTTTGAKSSRFKGISRFPFGTLIARLRTVSQIETIRKEREIEDMPEGLNEAEQKVFQALDDRVSLDFVQVACAALVTPGRTSEALDRLTERGLVRRVKRGPTPRFVRTRVTSSA